MNDIDKKLDLTDLKIMMETYQNMVQLNTILVEQHKQILEFQQRLLIKLDNISTKQIEINDKLKSVVSEMVDLGIDIEKANECATKSEISSVINTSGINRNIYIAWVGSFGIIASLITLFYTTINKFDTLKEINDMCIKILKHLNIY